MAAISRTLLKDFAQTAVAELVLDKAPQNDFQRILPFVPVDGYELKLAGVEAGGTLASFAGIETEGGTLASAVPTLTNRTFPMARIAAVLEVFTITQDKYSNANDILQTLLDLKSRAVRDLFCEKYYTGDSATTGEFDGVNKLATSCSQEIGANAGAADGGTVKKGELEKLRGMVQVARPGVEVVLVMHARAYQHLLAVNYSDVEFVNHPILGLLPTLAGVPIVVDNYIATNETQGAGTNLTSIYCFALGRGVGVTGIVPLSVVGGEIRVRGPVTSETAGKMTYHVSWDVGIAVWNKGGFARMKGVAWQNVT